MRLLTPLEKEIVKSWSRLRMQGHEPNVWALQLELSFTKGMCFSTDSLRLHVKELQQLGQFGE